MKKISAIIIAKNEEKLIKECMESVAFCDEILVVDGGSEDKTNDIAKNMGAKIIKEPFSDFATARNIGLQKATGEWVFYIDADERVTKELQKSIEDIVASASVEHAAYKVHRKNFFLGNHPWPHIESMERLFYKKDLTKWFGELHESAQVNGSVGTLHGYLLHYTHRNLTLMVAKTNTWSTIEAKLRFDAHHPPVYWWRFPRVMLTAFYEYFITQKGYKAGVVGVIEGIYQAFSMFITYAKLWEMQENQK